MNSKLALAALIAATLALGACSKGPQPKAAEAEPATDTAAPPGLAAGMKIGWSGRSPYGQVTGGDGYVESNSFIVPRLVGKDGHGTHYATALFHTESGGNVVVAGTAGRVIVGTSPVNGGRPYQRIVEQSSQPTPVPVMGGWYQLSVACASEVCSDITATIDGEPFIPFTQR